MSKDIKVNRDQLGELIRSGETVIVDFYADWCGPCQMFLPVFHAEADISSTKLVKVNVDDDEEAAAIAGVQGIPTVIAFKGGVEVARNTGFMQPAELKAFIEKVN